MTRTREQWLDIIARSLDGDLTPRERLDLETALTENPDVQQWHARFTVVRQTCRGLSTETLGEDFDLRLKRCLRHAALKARLGRASVAVAAVLAVAVGLNQWRLNQAGVAVAHSPQSAGVSRSAAGQDKAVAGQTTFGQGRVAEAPQLPVAAAPAQATGAAAGTPDKTDGQKPRAVLSHRFASTLRRATKLMKNTLGKTVASVPRVAPSSASAATPSPGQQVAVADGDKTGVVAAAVPDAPAPVTATPATPPAERAAPPADPVASPVAYGRAAAVAPQPSSPLWRSPRQGPVRLVSYVASAEDGLVSEVRVKVDRRLSWMQFQQLAALLGAQATQPDLLAWQAQGEGQGVDAATRFAVSPQALVRFLSSLAGPTPLMTLVEEPGQRPVPVLLSEMLPRLRADLTVVLMPTAQ